MVHWSNLSAIYMLFNVLIKVAELASLIIHIHIDIISNILCSTEREASWPLL